MSITLQSIRDAKTFEALKPAIRFLCDSMQTMPWGEFTEFQRAIGRQAVSVGSTLEILNKYAETYQLYGPEKEPIQSERLKAEIELAGFDYCVSKNETVEELNRRIDHLRLCGMTNIEELIQLILANEEKSNAIFLNVSEQVDILSDIAKRLRKV